MKKGLVLVEVLANSLPLGTRITFTRPVTIDTTDFDSNGTNLFADYFDYQPPLVTPAKKKSRKKKSPEVAEWPTERKRRIVLE